MDVTNAQSVAEAIREAAARLGKLDILVNNAGVTRTKPFLEIDEADWDQQVDTNLKGAFLAAQAAASVMRDQGGGGAIVNIASILGLRVAGQVAAYLTSKSGYRAFDQRHGARTRAPSHQGQCAVPRLYRNRP